MDEETVTTEEPKAVPRMSAARPLPFEFAAAFRAWARHTFSRASLANGLKSLAWVAPLSVLIWIYAEREQVATLNAFPISVTVRSPDSTRVVTLLEPSDAKVRADLSGPNGRLEHVRDLLENNSQSVVLDVPETLLARPGSHELSTSMVNNVEPFLTNGVTVLNVVPRVMTVYVDVLEDVDVDVVPGADGSTLAATPVFEPRKVRVHAAHSVIESARQRGQLVAYAKLDGTREQLTPGSHDLTGVPVGVAFSEKGVSVAPSVVSAHVEVKKSDITLTLPAIPVWVVYPPGMEDKYKATYDPSLANVKVSGPEEQIRALQSPNFEPKPKAMFEVSASDLPVDTDHEKRLRFDLPPDVHVSPDDARRTISFRLVERHAGE